MDEINALMHGFSVALTPFNLFLMFVGVVLGILIGVLPGLGGANGVAILLPLTFAMGSTPAGQVSAIIMHLLGRVIWRCDYVHPVQHSRRTVVGGDNL
jgi:TctA family transporter